MKVVVVMLTVGVPLIVPALRVRPAGRAGWTAQVLTAPPVFAKVIDVIVVPLVRFTDAVEGVIEATGSLMVIVIDTDEDPFELLAQIV